MRVKRLGYSVSEEPCGERRTLYYASTRSVYSANQSNPRFSRLRFSSSDKPSEEYTKRVVAVEEESRTRRWLPRRDAT